MLTSAAPDARSAERECFGNVQGLGPVGTTTERSARGAANTLDNAWAKPAGDPLNFTQLMP
ncbi:hypothetical protein ACFW5W_37550, partial [Streptomyces sp. NPDC058783]|uniref:hypothetical protein n=1 Tax=Streptomyces sp. NPDC058783 TaxID=3346633 RepID=UPI0036B50EA0